MILQAAEALRALHRKRISDTIERVENLNRACDKALLNLSKEASSRSATPAHVTCIKNGAGDGTKDLQEDVVMTSEYDPSPLLYSERQELYGDEQVSDMLNAAVAGIKLGISG